MAMSARIMLAFCFLVACQEAPQLALDPVADGSVDAGPEALELTKLWVTALPPLPAIHFEAEDRTYPLILWHRIQAVITPTLMAEFANATPSQPIYARYEFRFDDLLVICVSYKELFYWDEGWGNSLTRELHCESLDPEIPSLTSEQWVSLYEEYPVGEFKVVFTSEGFASTSRTYQIRLCSMDMIPQELPGNECDLREPE
ncbi:MAG TPA: hypothetical protein RMG48_04750 [Myxococcales bacterium LLY-WYZ-16_1]|nr:hypothetical protein [Myxococcales bacterium LLY-WYZ-16_1]